jgi:hypothetical protein
MWVGMCAAVMALTQNTAAPQNNLPRGWRAPTREEASGSWRQKSPTQFLKVKGDFDGDGRVDVAQILVDPSAGKFGLFVKLGGADQWQLLRDFDLTFLGRYGIDYVKPGKYETACGEGYGDWACAHKEPDWLQLSHPGIDLFYTESSDSIHFWDQPSKKFREIVMSD